MVGPHGAGKNSESRCSSAVALKSSCILTVLRTLTHSLTHTNSLSHGAGLTHTLFMPDRAWLVEIFIDGSTGLEHFNNMHAWRHSQKKYFCNAP
jgi:hypothetical protein